MITQRPSELDAAVLSQGSTTFAMRIANETDKKIIADAFGASTLGIVTLLPSITDREAIAFGQALAMPMRMKISDVALHSKQRGLAVSEAASIDLDWLCRRLRDGVRTTNKQVRNAGPPDRWTGRNLSPSVATHDRPRLGLVLPSCSGLQWYRSGRPERLRRSWDGPSAGHASLDSRRAVGVRYLEYQLDLVPHLISCHVLKMIQSPAG